MPPLSKDEMDSFLQKSPVAILCTHNSDGTIHAAPVWFQYNTNNEILFATQDDTRRIKNIKKNPDVTVVVETEQLPYKGVVIYGKANLDYDNVLPRRTAMYEKYMPHANAEKLAKGLGAMRKAVLIRVRPSKITSYDYGKDQSGLFK